MLQLRVQVFPSPTHPTAAHQLPDVFLPKRQVLPRRGSGSGNLRTATWEAKRRWSDHAGGADFSPQDGEVT